MLGFSFSLRAHYWLRLLLLTSLLGVPAMYGAGIQDAASTPDNAQPAAAPVVSAKEGDAIYHKRCVVCHSKQKGDNSPFGPPNLYSAFHSKTPVSSRVAETIITNGKGQMPAFGSTLSKTEIRCVIAYLKSQ